MNLSPRQSDITKSRCDFVRSVGCLLTLGSLADSSAEREKDGVQRQPSENHNEGRYIPARHLFARVRGQAN